MTNPVISATGLWTPPHSISNAELVESYNAWADNWNRENEAEIKSGLMEPKTHSSVEFIEKASGIKSRFVVDKDGVLDPDIMAPRLAERPNEQISILAEMAVHAAREALKRAGRDPKDVNAVICAASNMQRAYPAMAIEVQDALGIEGFAFDMNVACSSATFGIQTAADFIRSGNAKSVLVVNPEICSGHLNFTDRDSHFIFGDVATAVLVEAEEVLAEQAKQSRLREAFLQISDLCQRLLTLLSNGTKPLEAAEILQMNSVDTLYRRKNACTERWREVYKGIS